MLLGAEFVYYLMIPSTLAAVTPRRALSVRPANTIEVAEAPNTDALILPISESPADFRNVSIHNNAWSV